MYSINYKQLFLQAMPVLDSAISIVENKQRDNIVAKHKESKFERISNDALISINF